MNMPLAAHAVIDTVATWWRDRMQISAELEEIGRLSYEDLEEVASDCGMTALQLVDVIKAGPHGSDEMLALMKALNIDPDAVREFNPRNFREMQVACARCGSKSECRSHLADGSIAGQYRDYCENADVMNALRAQPMMLSE
ncbi:hypothetical protein M2360_002071 [Rhizobium sp. SG_E_25_P2]|uniref:DUF6455 family protein n=1 Tax=Rhizobium sp. SG_E_25_P2 TaxID=2879942 RepID=UPI0024747123|nr:DUF6455 family protein [Rhizobium sp. SG_E_25_P2]MDH6266675.1 hypothetical protein [Rhizobium sp. SG_E_25_P2]